MAITIPIVTSYDGKGMDRAVRDIAKAEGGWGKTTAAMSALQGPALAVGGAIVAGATVAVKAASDLEQAVGGMDAVFGSASGQISKFADTAADTVGLSKAEFQQLATVAGAAFQSMGLSQDQAAGKTVEMTKRAADMAAVFGGSVADAMSAMQAGLRGELDPLEKYGVKLSAAAVEAQAMADTGKTVASTLTDQEKQLAAYNLMMQSTSATAGQYSAQQGTVAEQTQRLQANLSDAAAALGEQLLPYVSDFVSGLSDMVSWLGQNSDIIVPLVAAIGAFAAAIVAINTALSIYETVMTAAAIAQEAFNISMAANPVGLVIAAITALVAVVALLVMNWDTITAKAKEIWQKVAAYFSQLWEQIKAGITAAWNAIKSAAEAVWNGIVAALQAIWEGLKALVTGYFNAYVSVVTGAWNAIKSVASSVWNGITGVISGAVNGIKGVLSGIKGIIDQVISWFNTLANKVKSFMSGPINAVKGFVGGLFSDAPEDVFASTVNIGASGPPPPPPAGGWSVPRLAGGAVGGSSRTTIVNVSGAIDPEATARQIRSLLDGSAYRNGARVTRAQSW